MKILLIHSEIRTKEPPRHPPYGLLQLAAITDSLGYKIAVLDNNAYRLPIDAVRQQIKGDMPIDIDGILTRLPGIDKHALPDDAENFARLLKSFTDHLLKIKAALIGSEQWDVIGITGLTTQYKFVKQLAKMCREEFPAALMVAGGGFLSSQPFDIMRWIPEFDVGCVGEGYITWHEILEQIPNRNWKGVKGIVYREGKNVKLTSMRPLIEEFYYCEEEHDKKHYTFDQALEQEFACKCGAKLVNNLDEQIPFPAYEFSPVETYLMNSAMPYCPELFPRPGYMPMRLDVLASYGCPYTCQFCFHVSCQTKVYGKQFIGKPFRQHSPDYVVRLIDHLHRHYGINFASFIDENFTVKRNWFYKFCETLEEHDLATLIKWGIVGHSATVDTEMLQKGHDCGLCYISYGGETSCEKLLKQIKKGQTKERMVAAIESTHSAGVNPIMSFIIGFPDTTIDNVIEDCQFFIDNQIYCDPFFLQPYPGTEYYDKYKDKIIEQNMTDDEKAFIKKPTKELYDRIFGQLSWISQTQIQKNAGLLNGRIKDNVLERWVLSLDDAVKMSVNLTEFTDVELAGLRYLWNMWDIERLKKFRKILEKRTADQKLLSCCGADEKIVV